MKKSGRKYVEAAKLVDKNTSYSVEEAVKLAKQTSITNFDQFLGFTKATDPDQYYVDVVRPIKLELQLYYRYHHNLRDDFRCIMWTGYKVLTRSSRLPKEIQKIVDDYKDTNSKQK